MEVYYRIDQKVSKKRIGGSVEEYMKNEERRDRIISVETRQYFGWR